MKTKDEVIAAAYGEHWDAVKEFVDKNGWILCNKRDDRFDEVFESINVREYFDYEIEACFLRPFDLEFWMPVDEYLGIYDISDLGRIKSLERNKKGSSTGIHKIKEKVLSPNKSNSGYFKITLHNGDLPKRTVTMHSLVANAFLENPENKPQTNHKNGDKTLNWLINLEKCTRSENVKHADTLGLRKMPKGKNHANYGIESGKHGMAKKVINKLTKEILPSAIDLSILLNQNASTLRNKLNGADKNETDWIYLIDYNHNNGWTKIESESNLPTINNVECAYIYKGNIERGDYVSKHFDRPKTVQLVSWKDVTHYRVIEPFDKPHF